MVDNLLADLLGEGDVWRRELLNRLLRRRHEGWRVVLVDVVAVAARALRELCDLCGLLRDVHNHRRVLANAVVAQRRDAQAVDAVVHTQVWRHVQHKAKVTDTVDRSVRLVVHAAVSKHVADERKDLVDLPPEGGDVGRERLQRRKRVQNVNVKHHAELLHHDVLVVLRHVRRVYDVVELLGAVDKDSDEGSAGLVLNVLDLGSNERTRKVVVIDALCKRVDVRGDLLRRECGVGCDGRHFAMRIERRLVEEVES